MILLHFPRLNIVVVVVSARSRCKKPARLLIFSGVLQLMLNGLPRSKTCVLLRTRHSSVLGLVTSVLLLLRLTAYDLEWLLGGRLSVERLHGHIVGDAGLRRPYFASLRPLSLLLLHIVICNVAQVYMGTHFFVSLLS